MSGKLGKMWCAVVGAMCVPTFACAQEVLEECPREHLREVYLQAVERHEMVDLAAVEVEVLKLCRERQGLISDIVRGEEELAKLLAPAGAEVSAASSAPPARPGDLPALLPASRQRSATGSSGEKNEAASANSGSTVRGGGTAPGYRWFTVYGSGNSLVAGITDGRDRWWVRKGDRLPGGVEVVEVGVRPISVRALSGGRQWQLSGPRGATAAGAAVGNESQ